MCSSKYDAAKIYNNQATEKQIQLAKLKLQGGTRRMRPPTANQRSKHQQSNNDQDPTNILISLANPLSCDVE